MQYAPQRGVYHVTDTAALINASARDAAEVLRAMRQGELDPRWEASTLTVGLAAERDAEGGAPLEVLAHVRLVG
jgi:hypothetical protein